jgi:hypothetical protein
VQPLASRWPGALTVAADDKEVLTVEFKVNFLAPAAGEVFAARAQVKKAGRTLTVCTTDAFAISDGREMVVCNHAIHNHGGADNAREKANIGPFSRIGVCPYLTLTGSAVPSDHQPAGTMNTSIGSGAPLNCGFSMTGDLDRSAPQTAPSMSGV